MKKLKLKRNILVSSGYKNIHINNQAYELQKTNKLFSIISGYIPKKNYIFFSKLPFLSKRKILNRIVERKNNINDNKIINFLLGEVFFNISLIFYQKKIINYRYLDRLIKYSLNLFSNFAKKIILKHHNKIKYYHFRSGYGGVSLNYAKTKNIYTICDHTIAHPDIVQYMIDNKGKYPNKKILSKNNWWRNVTNDLNNSDHILVNSHFVKKTLEFMGIKKKIDVIYTGVNKFFETKKSFKKRFNKKKKILYAGGITQRKGIYFIQEALKKIKNNNFELRIAGSISNYDKKKYELLFKDTRVKYLGNLNAKELKVEYKNSDIFLFPSLVEGSAKVIFEAMSSGCAIITTPNSGSIVKNKKNGILIETGNSSQIIKAINKLINNEKLIKIISKNNIKIINEKYKQSDYGKKLNNFYNKLNEQFF